MIQLPLNCTAHYYPGFFPKEKCDRIFSQLYNEFQISELKTEVIYKGEKILTDHGKLMFMDENLYHENKLPEEIWGKTATWTKELMELKEKIEVTTGTKFQVCVCIYYPNGNTGVSFHSDMVAYGDTSIIPSISIGEEREFQLKEKATQDIFEIKLEEGSMIVMGENCQKNYEHALPTNPKYKNARINLTFRKYGY